MYTAFKCKYNSLGAKQQYLEKVRVQERTGVNNNWFGSDLFWLSFGPVVLPLLTYEDAVLGSVDQHVKRHKAHDAG